VGGKPSYSIIFDSGANRSIVADKVTKGYRQQKVSPYLVTYGGGNSKTMEEMAKVEVMTEGKKMEV
jgi:hypothetical protein